MDSLADIGILQLVQARGVGDATLARILASLPEAGVYLREIASMAAADLERALGLERELCESICAAGPKARDMAEELAAHDVVVMVMGHLPYPAKLERRLGGDAPPVLFAKGNLALLERETVGFCGSRKASGRGLRITADAAAALAEEGMNVVSGYANGVDLAAHTSAVAHGGTTTLVLAEGILRFRRKSGIADLLEESNHVILSQFPPRLPWSGRNAMRRNSTIIGLADAMILVEAAMTGGTFAAGTEALERGRPLFVVDLAQPEPSAEGNPHFLTRGGTPLRGDTNGKPNMAPVLAVLRSDVAEPTRLRQRVLFP